MNAAANREDGPMSNLFAATPAIDGATQLLAIVGDPVRHAKSPGVINALLAKAGHNAVLVPWHARPEEFASVMQGLLRTQNLVGLVITYPYKQQALAFVDDLLPAARQVGAVNALRRGADGRWSGDMFDGLGLVRAVQGLGRPIAGAAVKLLGAGGAGGAIAFALADAGAAALSIFDTDHERAKTLAAAVRAQVPGCAATAGDATLGDATILVNATPVGMAAGDGLPADMTGLHAGIAVVDIVPRQDGTPLLALARARGCPHVGGAAMVEGQAALLLEFFGFSPMAGAPA